MRPIRPMSAVERFLERLLERPSARLFGTRIQPVQLQGKVERAMEHGKMAGRSGVRAPDRFTIRLRPQDLAGLDELENLAVDLASHALDLARRHGYALQTRPRVALVGDDRLRPGDIDVEARFSGLGVSPDQAAVDPSRTWVFHVPVVRSPQVTMDVLEPTGRRRMVVARGAPLTIGRASDNGLALEDDRVSRHHARMQGRAGLMVLTDLHSTNGTRVNGIPAREVAVGDGDVIEIGDCLLTVVSIDEA
ncbi:MAG: DUF3662 domain-containing protein [Chloroflexi bacterium]|nr:DUF3662 domain-containing protein [Chloroflexota bacterium]